MALDPTKPSKPYCLSDYSNTCKSYEIDSYNTEVDSYNSSLSLSNNDVDEYVGNLKQYITDTVDYAKCEARRVAEE